MGWGAITIYTATSLPAVGYRETEQMVITHQPPLLPDACKQTHQVLHADRLPLLEDYWTMKKNFSPEKLRDGTLGREAGQEGCYAIEFHLCDILDWRKSLVDNRQEGLC